MKLSGFLLKLTKIALNTLIKSTNANIRTYNEENILNQPTLYVINHFTRMETFFLPYVISKITGKDVLSLAAEELFGGSFGNYLEKIGAIPTNAPDRDRIMIGSLIKGYLPCLIFPEGQMIKDKKIIERGKYVVYNSGIRRPPHTGASILALRSEFYREKLRSFHKNRQEDDIRAYCEYFEINSEEALDEILELETHIQPVNVSYFPVRAKKNILNKIANKFVDSLPERLEEELSVEGTMIVDGVDIDINFGKPISIRQYLSSRKIKSLLHNNKLYLKNEEIKKDLRFNKEATQLMYRYMNSIYQMTRINHDNIFSYILSKYKDSKINIKEFKNRSFLAIEKIKSLDNNYLHNNLKLNQDALLTDDEHINYNSFIEAALSDSLISIHNGYIIKNKEKFSKIYDFHSIRKDNLLEVLKNEIEPLQSVVKSLNRLMMTPAFLIRKQIRNMFWEMDKNIFVDDYERFYVEGEAKPKNIGEPFFLKRPFSKKGVILVHGFMSAPEEMKELANYLYSNGFNVYGVRMKGHGTSPQDLSNINWQEWHESVKRGYIVLRNTLTKIAIIGFSTGAGLALLEAAQKKNDLNCIISINAPLKLSNISSNFASVIVLWNNILEKFRISKVKMEFVTNDPENPNINYPKIPISGVRELEKMMDIVHEKLKDIDIPILVIQGSNDPVVNPESGLEIFEKISTKKKELNRIFSEHHVIVRGEDSYKIFLKVKRFLNDNM